jgi:hypothetical protein
MKNHPTTGFRITVFAAAWLAACGAGFAQDAPPAEEKPKPAAKVYGPIGSEGQDQDASPADLLQPDNRPLTGLQQPTVGAPPEKHSYWVPGVSYYNFIQSSGALQGGGNDWNSTSYVSGNVSLLQNWSRSQLALNYSGGGNFSTDSALGNGWFQQLDVVQTFNWERLQLTLLDDFSYLPQTQFGFGTGTGLSLPGVGGTLGGGTTGLGGQYNPGGSIFFAVGPRYTNAFGAQVNYVLSRRSSVTLGGVYSLLRFTESGNIESNDYLANVGYNYQISKLDTIGVVYRFSAYHYIGAPQAIGDHSIQAVYGRKITGRLALQLSGGPEISMFKVAQAPSTKTRYVGGAAAASLTYAVPRGGLGLSYSHGVTSGSGVFFGATTDQFTGSATRRVSREWTGGVHVGFAHNRNTQNTPGVPAPSFNSVYAGGSVARPLGRNASFSLGYTGYHESSSNVGGFSFTTHQISLGLSWHTRPLVLH